MIINASPLIIFGKLNKLSLLKNIYNKLEIVNSVFQEVVVKGIEINSKDAFIINDYINTENIKILNLNEKFSNKAGKIQLIYTIDIGEAETIALALQLNEKEAIIDEISAREAAKAFKIKPIGSLRVLLVAYTNNLINKEEVNDIINEMENSKYRFSPQVLIEFWNLFKKIK